VIEIGDSVVVREPTPDDLWQHSFSGSIDEIIETVNGRIYKIVDSDGDVWDLERSDFEFDEEY